LSSPEDGSPLITGLSQAIARGTRVLVVGPNETARVALFRATAGIWPTGTGKIVRPPLDSIFFLPQRPYLPPGTLRDLLIRTGRCLPICHRTTIELPRLRSADLMFHRSELSCPEWVSLTLLSTEILGLSADPLPQPSASLR